MALCGSQAFVFLAVVAHVGYLFAAADLRLLVSRHSYSVRWCWLYFFCSVRDAMLRRLFCVSSVLFFGVLVSSESCGRVPSRTFAVNFNWLLFL